MAAHLHRTAAMGAGFTAEAAGQALQIEAFARRFYSFFNERRFDQAESMVHQQAIFSYPAGKEDMIGRAGYREIVRRWTEGLPDGRVSIRSIHVWAETAVTDLEAEGTHTGVLDLPGFPPIPPTGRDVRLTLRETLTVRKGHIVDARMEFDPAELRRALQV